MKNLETRIKSIAANMEGKFLGEVPHTIFVEWDSTWDISGELDIDENSTDKEIEQAILTSEDWHGETYQEEVQAYIDDRNGLH